ncbi:MAG: hypothetical protein H6730_24455 [Deltaproteobacteria bacterium]|nr:hypothetical protein [Deltaproteobacteria bacterium]
MKRHAEELRTASRSRAKARGLATILVGGLVAAGGSARADVPGRDAPSYGLAVPNPGTQQQELTNITAPGEYNVFEFVVTCAGCHGGSIDQHTGHFSNWAGSSMASAARDPIFRANQVGVNAVVRGITGMDGAGNVCFRCHSPNGWLSGRFDPSLGGKADGSNMIQSILLSTDGEGIMCETCHRVSGNVTFKRQDLSAATNDSTWNLLAGIFDWEHEGRAMTDQEGTQSIAPGSPFGDTALQFQDNISYVGKYSGTGDLFFSDLPLDGTVYTGQIYAVYPDWWVAQNAIYPSIYPINPAPPGMPVVNSAGDTLAYAADGSLPPVFEVPIGIPIDPNTGLPNYALQGLSLEHPTTGSAGRVGALVETGNYLPVLSPGLTPANELGETASPDEFIRTSEFCGSCHDLTVPVLNHGMPEQRTYSEWKHSVYATSANVISDPLGKRTGTGVERCQDCHMPTLRHEYSDAYPDSLNPDPLLSGGFPYGKNRGPQGGTALHKLAGANRDLPMMMKALYPEVDLEVVGAPTGKDPRAFPGMLSDRGPMWDRNQENTEIMLHDGVDAQITVAPEILTNATSPNGIVYPNGDGAFRLAVRVYNRSGHRIPSGYPDGRRFWLQVRVTDTAGNLVYQSGAYDEANAQLATAENADGSFVPFRRAIEGGVNALNAANNAVMVYERVTGTCTDASGAAIFPDPTAGVPASCTESPALTNNFILFDNRIPPKGLDYATAREAGVKFWNYDPATGVPYEDSARYAAGELNSGSDAVVYRFRVPASAMAAVPAETVLNATVEVYWQTHTREFMEHLRNQDTTTVRPQRPPNPLDPNYPNNPNYISDSIAGLPLASYTALDGSALRDNWGGVAYAAWLATGKGAPFLVDRDDTTVTTAPTAPANVVVSGLDSGDPEYIDPVTLAPDSFAAKITWDPVPNADGYMIWIRYGASDTTADWDRLAIVDASTTRFVEHVLGHAGAGAKSYGFKVEAFNGRGSAVSAAASYTIADVAMVSAPNNMTASQTAAEGSTNGQIKLTWFDTANNEVGFEVWRYGPVSQAGIPTPATQNTVTILGDPNGPVGMIPNQTGGPAGGAPITGTNTWVDDGAMFAGTAPAPESCYLYQVRAIGINLDVSTWSAPRVQGCTTLGITVSAIASASTVDLSWTAVAGATGYMIVRSDGVTTTPLGTVATTSYTDATVLPNTTYAYTVTAVDAVGTALDAGSASVTTLAAVPAAPSNVQVAATVDQITVTWTDNATTEDGFVLERSANGGVWTPIPDVGAYIVNPSAATPSTVTYVDSVAAGGLQQGTVYQYRVKAVDLVNGESAYATSGTISLVSVPVAPSTFTAALSTDVFGALPLISLAWSDVAGETNYLVERHANRCDQNNGWTAVASVGADVLAATDATVTQKNNDATYCYRLRASNAAGSSPWINVLVTVPARPAAPLALDAFIDGSTITMEFQVPAGLLGYMIEKRERIAGIGWTDWAVVQVAPGAGGGYSYVDAAVISGNQYRYRISYANTGGWSASTVSGTISY